jgi:hypothetical protein
MATSKDWLPRNHEKLLAKAILIFDYINATANRDRMGFAHTSRPGIWFDDTYGPNVTYLENAVKVWRDPVTRTKGIIAALKDAEKVFIPIIRTLYRSFLKNNLLVTNQDLVNMELPERNDSRTPVPIPKSRPSVIEKKSDMRIITLTYVDSESGKKGKPAGVHEAVAYWKVFPEVQAEISADELTRTSFSTRSSISFEFSEKEHGHFFHYVLQWRNTKAEGGPIGDVDHITIS